jgi:hypothetical protein
VGLTYFAFLIYFEPKRKYSRPIIEQYLGKVLICSNPGPAQAGFVELNKLQVQAGFEEQAGFVELNKLQVQAKSNS